MSGFISYRDGSKEIISETIRFQVVADDGVWLVREVSNAYSFSRVPANFTCEFMKKSVALEQVRRLAKWQEKGTEIELQQIDTPSAFEHVADTKYGCEW